MYIISLCICYCGNDTRVVSREKPHNFVFFFGSLVEIVKSLGVNASRTPLHSMAKIGKKDYVLKVNSSTTKKGGKNELRMLIKQ